VVSNGGIACRMVAELIITLLTSLKSSLWGFGLLIRHG
jgi:hypothetical protein